MAYPLETILAEKYETIIRRNITTIRMKFDVGVIRQKYTRNFIENVSDTIDDTIKLTNIISKKSQLEILPKSIIKDVDSELERIKLENNDSLFVEE